jgi:hypothetical protein
MSLLTIIYWVLLVLAAIGALAPGDWAYPRANAVVILVLFIIIGIKLLKPTL